MSKIIVERDCDDSDMRELPPVLPMDLSSMSSRSFSLVLIQHSTRLKNKFSDEEFELVDKQFSRLEIAVRENLELKKQIDTFGQNKGYTNIQQLLESTRKQLRSFKTTLRGYCQCLTRDQFSRVRFLHNQLDKGPSCNVTNIFFLRIYIALQTAQKSEEPMRKE